MNALTQEIIGLESEHLVQTYKRPPFVITRGQGVMLYDAEDNEYLDMVAGIAVNALGYADPGMTQAIQEAATGLLLDPYFSATKMRWLLDNQGQVRAAAEGGRLAFGTIESWLAFKLSGGAHVSDASNASRTLLLRLDGAQFDAGLCELFGVPPSALPEVVDTQGALAQTDPQWFGRALPICGLIGDQQAATVGQGCLVPGQTKATFGTGAFVLATLGEALPRSGNRLLGTVLEQQNGRRSYALEGSVFVAGSLIQWLRDSLGVLGSAAETEALARSIPDSGGVTIVPALSGLGAPHWRPEARGVIAAMRRSSVARTWSSPPSTL